MAFITQFQHRNLSIVDIQYNANQLTSCAVQDLPFVGFTQIDGHNDDKAASTASQQQQQQPSDSDVHAKCQAKIASLSDSATSLKKQLDDELVKGLTAENTIRKLTDKVCMCVCLYIYERVSFFESEPDNRLCVSLIYSFYHQIGEMSENTIDNEALTAQVAENASLKQKIDALSSEISDYKAKVRRQSASAPNFSLCK